MQIIFYPLFSIGLIAILDVGLTYFRYRKIYLPTAALVSGFLIGLILAPSESVLVISSASLLASLSKQFLAIGARRHIFNPAALGIMGVYLTFGTTVSWWGVSWSWYPLVILIPLMSRILLRLKRFFLPLTFLTIYFFYILLTGSLASAWQTIVDPTVLMFALVMLPEPITSPTVGNFKYLFGAIVAILAIIISTFTQVGEVFLPALLLANLGVFLLSVKTLISKKRVK